MLLLILLFSSYFIVFSCLRLPASTSLSSFCTYVDEQNHFTLTKPGTDLTRCDRSLLFTDRETASTSSQPIEAEVITRRLAVYIYPRRDRRGRGRQADEPTTPLTTHRYTLVVCAYTRVMTWLTSTSLALAPAYPTRALITSEDGQFELSKPTPKRRHHLHRNLS